MYEPGRRFTLWRALRKAARESGKPVWRLLSEHWRLKRAGRRLLLTEYLAFGLYRRGARPEAFIGVIEGAILALAINYRKNRRALVHDKLLFDAMLRGLGYPVPHLQAVIGAVGQQGAFAALRGPGQVRAFLESDARYPLFIKPAKGQNSLGAVAIDRLDHGAGDIVLLGEDREPVAQFTERLCQQRDGPLLVQSYIDQHPDLTRMTGPTIGCIRVISFLERGTPKILRAFWKIPLGNTVADNLWRGNMIAAVNETTGRIGTVRAGTMPGARTLTHHPLTGASLSGVELPYWPEVRSVCESAAHLMRGMPLIGWDVAISREGPVLIEANSVPSAELTQYPEQRGFLVGDLLARIEAELARLKTDEVRDAKEKRRRIRTLLMKRILPGF